MPQKKASRRSKKKFASLEPQYNLKRRQELIDFDYLSKLSDKDKTWLAKFNEEYTNASFDKDPKKNLHKSKALKKSVYDANNARNRDILTRAKAAGKFHYIEDVLSSEEALHEHLKESLDGSYNGDEEI